MKRDMPKNARPRPGKLEKLRADKTGSINTSLFNFLENLLVFRTVPGLSVKPESSVKFRISREQGDPGICLLIHVDNTLFPVVAADALRPDYLALYLHGSDCLCTIIEMKSRDGKNLKHGLEQIKALAERLEQEFALHLPRRFRLKVQGILLCQENASVPNPLIAQMDQAGLTILATPCNSRAELYPYISQKNDLKTVKFRNISRSPAPPGPLEEMLSQDALRVRLPDRLADSRPGAGAGTGLHINYVLSAQDEYATLITRGKHCVFVVSEAGSAHEQRLRQDLQDNGLGDKFLVEAL